ncbi:DUF1758 domain-containing protein [Trichonephila clavipes]|nr:DUF1758 domain-containing protein [Trichonephila clavipes]
MSQILVERVKIKELDYLEGIPLADEDFSKPWECDVILGSNCFFSILRNGRITGSKGQPIAQSTIFGWVVADLCSIAKMVRTKIVPEKKNEWCNILSSDEFRFSFHPDYRRIFIGRERGSRNKKSCVCARSVRFGGGGVISMMASPLMDASSSTFFEMKLRPVTDVGMRFADLL